MVHFEAADIHSLLYGWKEGAMPGWRSQQGHWDFLKSFNQGARACPAGRQGWVVPGAAAGGGMQLETKTNLQFINIYILLLFK